MAGKREGFEDMRGTLCFEMVRIINKIKPKYFLFENVKGLLTHDGGKTIERILEAFSGIGYEITMDVLNAKDYGIPQNRERLFCVGKRMENYVPKAEYNMEEAKQEAINNSTAKKKEEVILA